MDRSFSVHSKRTLVYGFTHDVSNVGSNIGSNAERSCVCVSSLSHTMWRIPSNVGHISIGHIVWVYSGQLHASSTIETRDKNCVESNQCSTQRWTHRMGPASSIVLDASGYMQLSSAHPHDVANGNVSQRWKIFVWGQYNTYLLNVKKPLKNKFIVLQTKIPKKLWVL